MVEFQIIVCERTHRYNGVSLSAFIMLIFLHGRPDFIAIFMSKICQPGMSPGSSIIPVKDMLGKLF